MRFCPENTSLLENEKSETLHFGNNDNTALLGKQKPEILQSNSGNVDDAALPGKQKSEKLQSNSGNIADYMQFGQGQLVGQPNHKFHHGVIKPATDYIPYDSKLLDISAKHTLPLRNCGAPDIPNSRLIVRNPHCLTNSIINDHPTNKESVIKANSSVTDYVKILPSDSCESTFLVGPAGFKKLQLGNSDCVRCISCIDPDSPLIKTTYNLSTSAVDSCDHVIFSDQSLPCKGSSKNLTHYSGVYISPSSIENTMTSNSSVHVFTPSHSHTSMYSRYDSGELSPKFCEKPKEVWLHRMSTFELSNTRPLSGVLLDLPPAYYLDQNLNDHYKTTEL